MKLVYKKSKYNLLAGVPIALLVILISGCISSKSKTFTIGFSQCTSGDLWRQTMNREMQRTAMFYDDLKLIIKDAKGSSDIQEEQIREFIKQEVDLLIITPNESEPITLVVTEAFQKGIPVILVDRKINGNDFTAFIGADNYQIGYNAASYLIKKFPKKLRIMEVWGLKGSSPAIERHQGFADGLKNHQDKEIVATIYGEWLHDVAYQEVKAIPPHIYVDAVFAHNDVMALGAREALEYKNNQITYIGVDALPGLGGGTQMVIEEKLTASLLYPTGGKMAIETAYRILHNLPFNRITVLPTGIIDAYNANEIENQYAITNSYMDDIDRQQTKLNNLTHKYYNLQLLTITTITILIAVILLTFLVIRANKKRNEVNLKLKKAFEDLSVKNQLIEEQTIILQQQKNELALINSAKDKLFSILAHDLRNPFNAITGFSRLIIDEGDELEMRDIIAYVELINQSSQKANDLLDNILQWSRLQIGHLSVQPEKINLSQLITDSITVVNGDLIRKRINLEHIIDPTIIVFADVNMIKTVLRNLVSNAIKYSPEFETISITASILTDKPSTVEIAIIDHGISMTTENAGQIFAAKSPVSTPGTQNETGTGLGLVICKEFIERNNGTISVISELNQGTTFTFTLPLA